ncbi:MAG TPA: ester cyclase [Candidatus Bathyarchaeia archaeon]|nr:ester cyclase [Candidatus Bathyarchaeia archaeon]
MISNEKMLVRRFYEEIINETRFDKLDEILTTDMILHDPLLPTSEVHGMESFKNTLEVFRLAFPDLHITIEDQMQEDERVVTRFAIQGTHGGDLMGIPATGRKFKISGISIIRFSHGKAVEEWIEEDGLASCDSLRL